MRDTGCVARYEIEGNVQSEYSSCSIVPSGPNEYLLFPRVLPLDKTRPTTTYVVGADGSQGVSGTALSGKRRAGSRGRGRAPSPKVLGPYVAPSPHVNAGGVSNQPMGVALSRRHVPRSDSNTRGTQGAGDRSQSRDRGMGESRTRRVGGGYQYETGSEIPISRDEAPYPADKDTEHATHPYGADPHASLSGTAIHHPGGHPTTATQGVPPSYPSMGGEALPTSAHPSMPGQSGTVQYGYGSATGGDPMGSTAPLSHAHVHPHPHQSMPHSAPMGQRQVSAEGRSHAGLPSPLDRGSSMPYPQSYGAQPSGTGTGYGGEAVRKRVEDNGPYPTSATQGEYSQAGTRERDGSHHIVQGLVPGGPVPEGSAGGTVSSGDASSAYAPIHPLRTRGQRTRGYGGVTGRQGKKARKTLKGKGKRGKRPTSVSKRDTRPAGSVGSLVTTTLGTDMATLQDTARTDGQQTAAEGEGVYGGRERQGERSSDRVIPTDGGQTVGETGDHSVGHTSASRAVTVLEASSHGRQVSRDTQGTHLPIQGDLGSVSRDGGAYADGGDGRVGSDTDRVDMTGGRGISSDYHVPHDRDTLPGAGGTTSTYSGAGVGRETQRHGIEGERAGASGESRGVSETQSQRESVQHDGADHARHQTGYDSTDRRAYQTRDSQRSQDTRTRHDLSESRSTRGNERRGETSHTTQGEGVGERAAGSGMVTSDFASPAVYNHSSAGAGYADRQGGLAASGYYSAGPTDRASIDADHNTYRRGRSMSVRDSVSVDIPVNALGARGVRDTHTQGGMAGGYGLTSRVERGQFTRGEGGHGQVSSQSGRRGRGERERQTLERAVVSSVERHGPTPDPSPTSARDHRYAEGRERHGTMGERGAGEYGTARRTLDSHPTQSDRQSAYSQSGVTRTARYQGTGSRGSGQPRVSLVIPDDDRGGDRGGAAPSHPRHRTDTHTGHTGTHRRTRVAPITSGGVDARGVPSLTSETLSHLTPRHSISRSPQGYSPEAVSTHTSQGSRGPRVVDTLSMLDDGYAPRHRQSGIRTQARVGSASVQRERDGASVAMGTRGSGERHTHRPIAGSSGLGGAGPSDSSLGSARSLLDALSHPQDRQRQRPGQTGTIAYDPSRPLSVSQRVHASGTGSNRVGSVYQAVGVSSAPGSSLRLPRDASTGAIDQAPPSAVVPIASLVNLIQALETDAAQGGRGWEGEGDNSPSVPVFRAIQSDPLSATRTLGPTPNTMGGGSVSGGPSHQGVGVGGRAVPVTQGSARSASADTSATVPGVSQGSVSGVHLSGASASHAHPSGDRNREDGVTSGYHPDGVTTNQTGERSGVSIPGPTDTPHSSSVVGGGVARVVATDTSTHRTSPLDALDSMLEDSLGDVSMVTQVLGREGVSVQQVGERDTHPQTYRKTQPVVSGVGVSHPSHAGEGQSDMGEAVYHGTSQVYNGGATGPVEGGSLAIDGRRQGAQGLSLDTGSVKRADASMQSHHPDTSTTQTEGRVGASPNVACLDGVPPYAGGSERESLPVVDSRVAAMVPHTSMSGQRDTTRASATGIESHIGEGERETGSVATTPHLDSSRVQGPALIVDNASIGEYSDTLSHTVGEGGMSQPESMRVRISTTDTAYTPLRQDDLFTGPGVATRGASVPHTGLDPVPYQPYSATASFSHTTRGLNASRGPRGALIHRPVSLPVQSPERRSSPQVPVVPLSTTGAVGVVGASRVAGGQIPSTTPAAASLVTLPLPVSGPSDLLLPEESESDEGLDGSALTPGAALAPSLTALKAPSPSPPTAPQLSLGVGVDASEGVDLIARCYREAVVTADETLVHVGQSSSASAPLSQGYLGSDLSLGARSGPLPASLVSSGPGSMGSLVTSGSGAMAQSRVGGSDPASALSLRAHASPGWSAAPGISTRQSGLSVVRTGGVRLAETGEGMHSESSDLLHSPSLTPSLSQHSGSDASPPHSVSGSDPTSLSGYQYRHTPDRGTPQSRLTLTQSMVDASTQSPAFGFNPMPVPGSPTPEGALPASASESGLGLDSYQGDAGSTDLLSPGSGSPSMSLLDAQSEDGSSLDCS
ncbi:hypothetical protein KIPB_006336 [Kipferlia bialata]|uniref:Uncharacterized protein n=1 Tax=Kipferlia bialata TaxID=797122 RepID=A0A391NLX0_9EUKA|nr:hypothetical protein KIPB_006336 [Kipferlia bialata]|eukprot:g6336.t1